MALPEFVNINGTRYAAAQLPREALAQVANIQAVDAELDRLNRQAGIAQAARRAYAAALVALVKDVPAAAPAAEEAPQTTH